MTVKLIRNDTIYNAKRFANLTPVEVRNATDYPTKWSGDEIFIVDVRYISIPAYVYDYEVEIIKE